VTVGRKETLGGKVEGIGDKEAKVATGERRISTRLVSLPVVKDADITISSRRFPSVANHVPRHLSELKPGMLASLQLTAGEDEIVKPLVVSKIVGLSKGALKPATYGRFKTSHPFRVVTVVNSLSLSGFSGRRTACFDWPNRSAHHSGQTRRREQFGSSV